jgi:uncharacterized cupin superfamily protein
LARRAGIQALAAEPAAAPHVHTFDELWHITRGTAQVTIENEVLRVDRGTLLTIPAGFEHTSPISVGDEPLEGIAIRTALAGVVGRTVRRMNAVEKLSPQRLFLEEQLLPQLDPGKRTLNVGVRAYSDYSQRFEAGCYVSVDIDEAARPNVVGDVAKLPFDDGSFEQVIFTGVFETLDDPWKAITEIYRVMGLRAKLLAGAPFRALWATSTSEASYVDRWRITPAGMRWLLRDFEIEEVIAVDDRYVFGIAHKGAARSNRSSRRW